MSWPSVAPWIPIEDLEECDLVVAYDPETGEYGERGVLDLIGGEGFKDLVNVTVNDAVITATAGHPFWVASEQAWVDAGELEAGDLVLSFDGLVAVEAVVAYQIEATVHNLHVEGIHTYYVQAGDEEVLVHNCEPRGGVYSLTDDAGTVVRTGRSNDLVRRMGEHARDPKLGEYKFNILHRSDDYATQRGLEQMAHDLYKPALNKINPISPVNTNRPYYFSAAEQFLRWSR